MVSEFIDRNHKLSCPLLEFRPCRLEGCAMWRWADYYPAGREPNLRPLDHPTIGYCGMANKPDPLFEGDEPW